MHLMIDDLDPFFQSDPLYTAQQPSPSAHSARAVFGQSHVLALIQEIKVPKALVVSTSTST